MTATEKDRRKAPRIPLKTPIVFKPLGRKKEFTSDYSENLSTNGIFLVTDVPLEIGIQLELHFSLPNSRKLIKAEGRVVWKTKHQEGKDEHEGVGIEFTKIDDESKKIISEFVERNVG